MFVVLCPGHRARVLLDEGAIRSMESTAAGIVVRWRCTCGSEGAFLTGAAMSANSFAALAEAG